MMKRRIAVFLAVLGIVAMDVPLTRVSAHIDDTAGGPVAEDEAGEEHNHLIPPTPSGDTMPIAFPNPLGTNSDIESILKSIIDWLIIIGAPIATGMIIFGAYQMLFAAGDPAKFKTGKTTILYTVIGYGIILIGWGIASIIEEILNLKPVA